MGLRRPDEWQLRQVPPGLKARRGAQRAAMTIAHKILVAVFHMLAKTIPFQEPGEAFLDQQAGTHAHAPRPTLSVASTTSDTTSSSGQRSPHDRPPSYVPDLPCHWTIAAEW